MDSPVRQYQKQKDYRRHKLFRKINRRRKAERQQAIDAPMKELRRKLKRYKDGKDEKKELPYPLRTSSDYDDNLAYQSGIKRDEFGHMMSTTQEEYPQERTYLKKPFHPTYGKAVWGDMAGGYQVYRKGDKDYSAPNFANLMYTKSPFKYGGGKDNTNKNSTMSTIKDVASFLPFVGTAIDGYDVIANGQYDKAPQFLLGLAGDTLGFGAAAKAYKAYKAYKALRTAKILAPNSISTPALYKAMQASNKAVNRGIAAAATDVVSHAENVADVVDYNSGKDSGIHIKPQNRGKFTALKKRTGKSASWFKAHGTPAQKKMATFALNSKHWSKKR